MDDSDYEEYLNEHQFDTLNENINDIFVKMNKQHIVVDSMENKLIEVNARR